MNSNSLAAALRTWAASAPDSLFSGVPWIIACWQAHEGDLAVSGLLAATYGLDTDSDAPAAAPNQIQIPATWLEYALKFDDRMFDLVTKRPAALGHLAGIGLVAAEPGPRDSAVVLAWIAADKVAIRVELHRNTDAVGRCEIGDPLWCDQQDRFEPLERYRAAACGRPPNLPADAESALPVLAPSATDWPGPH